MTSPTRITDDATARTHVQQVREQVRAAGENDPLDEAAERHLTHRGLHEAALWSVEGRGIAWRVEDTLTLAVVPDARGRGMGSALLEAAQTDASGPLEAWSHGNHPDAAGLAARFGWQRVRDLWVMRLPLSGEPTALPAQRPDPRIRAFRPGSPGSPNSPDAEQLIAVNAAAFADHPEQGAMDAADLAERMAADWFDPAGLLVAEVDGRIVGFHWTKIHPEGHGEVYVVGIDPAAQGQGLGRALTLAGLHHLAAQGVPEVVLYVESDNLPARAVYEGLGFTHADADTHVMYARG